MKTVNGASDYKVTEDGVVISVKRGYNKTMRTTFTKEGYERVGIVYDNGEKQHKLVHRLVAETYIPNPHNKPCVNHKDGNKQNNNVSNLEWVTYSENLLHAFDTGLKTSEGEKNSRNILTVQEVIGIYSKLLDGARVCDVADSYGVSRATVADIKFKRNWQNILNNLPDIKAKSKSKSLSESTVRWVCARLQDGMTAKQIVELSTNKTLTESMIWKIRSRQTYTEYSKDFNW